MTDTRHARLAVFAWCALVLLIILAASLAPLRLDFSSGHTGARWQSWLNSFRVRPTTWHLHRDLITNFLLYIPLGLLTPWLAIASRKMTFALLVLAGPLLSLAMEMAQLVTTNRYPSIWDFGSNSAGYIAGFTLSSCIIRRFSLTPAIFLGARGSVDRAHWAAALRFAYIPFLILCAVLPLDLKVGLGDIWVKLHAPAGAPRIDLNPFAPWSPLRLRELTLTLILFIPFSFLGALARGRQKSNAVISMAAYCALAALAIEILKLPVAARGSDILAFFAGAFGGIIGASLAQFWDRAQTHPADLNAAQPAVKNNLRPILLLMMILYSAFLWLQAWWPLDFLPSVRDAYLKFRTSTSWLPFRSYTGERSVSFFTDFIRETAWWIPLGFLAATWLSPILKRPPLQLAVILALGALFAAFVEFGQCLIASRWVDTTDILSHTLGLLLGFLFARLLKKP